MNKLVPCIQRHVNMKLIEHWKFCPECGEKLR